MITNIYLLQLIWKIKRELLDSNLSRTKYAIAQAQLIQCVWLFLQANRKSSSLSSRQINVHIIIYIRKRMK